MCRYYPNWKGDAAVTRRTVVRFHPDTPHVYKIDMYEKRVDNRLLIVDDHKGFGRHRKIALQ